MTWAVFLDRDGVVTDAPVVDGVALAPTRAEDLHIDPSAADAVTRLHDLGARVFVVTNQPDIARGTLAFPELERMHDAIRGTIAVDEVLVCPHDGADACACRKPLPGMLVDLARRWDVRLEDSWMVGDRWVDIAAGAAAGTKTILLERPYSWSPTSAGSPPADLHPDAHVDRLGDAVDIIASGRLAEDDA